MIYIYRLEKNKKCDISEIILICWFHETFLIAIHVETNCAAYYFCWNIQRLFKTEIFCNMNTFTVTFAEFNASLLNKVLIAS